MPSGVDFTQREIVGSVAPITEVEQVRLGNLFIGDDVVAPEPAALALLGVGLLAVGFRARRKRTQQGS
jgi:hypothetical protein